MKSSIEKILAALRRADRRQLFTLLGIALACVLVLLLEQRAGSEARERKTAAALQFEQAPERWLGQPRDISDFQADLRDGALAQVAIAHSSAPQESGTMLLYTRKNGEAFSARVPGCTLQSCSGTVVNELASLSRERGFVLTQVAIDWRPGSRVLLDGFSSTFAGVAAVALIAALLFAMTKMQGRVDGDAAAKLTERPDVTFDDVVGAEEAKAALQRVRAFMHDPSGYLELGARAPRGVLLKGPPGTGKTLLAKALAGEAKANFIAVDGSYFTSMFFGMGVLKVRNLFRLARKNAPCILFIDEIDGIGRRSDGAQQAGAAEMNRIINRVLVEMDGFGSADNVVVVGATNHEDNLDTALRRPGRFDMLVQVALPTVIERGRLFDLYVGKLRTEGAMDTAALARMTAGMSPADIANTVNKAASTAAEHRQETVRYEHLLRAIETQQLGGEVSALKAVISARTRTRIAWHEAGHALVAHLAGAGKVERVSIEPRGGSLGAAYITRESEEPLYGQGELTARLAMLLAGREAELLVFGDVSSGASDDLKKASELAVSMVATLGFSQAFGLLSVAGVPKELLGPDTQAAVLGEARAMLERAQAQCGAVFAAHRDRLDALASALLERDAMAGDDLRVILDGAAPTLLAQETVAA